MGNKVIKNLIKPVLKNYIKLASREHEKIFCQQIFILLFIKSIRINVRLFLSNNQENLQVYVKTCKNGDGTENKNTFS